MEIDDAARVGPGGGPPFEVTRAVPIKVPTLLTGSPRAGARYPTIERTGKRVMGGQCLIGRIAPSDPGGAPLGLRHELAGSLF